MLEVKEALRRHEAQIPMSSVEGIRQPHPSRCQCAVHDRPSRYQAPPPVAYIDPQIDRKVDPHGPLPLYWGTTIAYCSLSVLRSWCAKVASDAETPEIQVAWRSGGARARLSGGRRDPGRVHPKAIGRTRLPLAASLKRK